MLSYSKTALLEKVDVSHRVRRVRIRCPLRLTKKVIRKANLIKALESNFKNSKEATVHKDLAAETTTAHAPAHEPGHAPDQMITKPSAHAPAHAPAQAPAQKAQQEKDDVNVWT